MVATRSPASTRARNNEISLSRFCQVAATSTAAFTTGAADSAASSRDVGLFGIVAAPGKHKTCLAERQLGLTNTLLRGFELAVSAFERGFTELHFRILDPAEQFDLVAIRHAGHPPFAKPCMRTRLASIARRSRRFFSWS